MPSDPASTPNDPWLDLLVRRVRYLGWLLGTLVVVGVGVSLYGGITAVRTSDPAPATTAPAMLAVAPGGVIELSDIPAAFVVLYEGAEAHPEMFAQVPCFCGCDEFLDHRHLLDCFVRPDNSGWEAHASGCGVCLGEAQQVLALIEANEPSDSIVRQVIEEWGDPYLNTQES